MPPHLFWDWWYEWWVERRLPPWSDRLICGVTLPAFSTDVDVAMAAAADVGLEPISSDPEEICYEILLWVAQGSP